MGLHKSINDWIFCKILRLFRKNRLEMNRFLQESVHFSREAGDSSENGWFREAMYNASPELTEAYPLMTYGSTISEKAALYPPYRVVDSTIGDYTYVAANGHISETDIGRFCSIGPNLLSGYGVHPMNGLSTSPMFYSTRKQNGTTLSPVDKIEERKRITIGNDVFIGANVTLLDGVTVHDGAVIGAGAVVSKDIPPYAIAVGCPIKILRYRYPEATVQRLLKIKWWNFDKEKLARVEKYFYDVETFLQECE